MDFFVFGGFTKRRPFKPQDKVLLIRISFVLKFISFHAAETFLKQFNEVADNITRNQCAVSLESLVKKVVAMYIIENDDKLPTRLEGSE